MYMSYSYLFHTGFFHYFQENLSVVADNRAKLRQLHDLEAEVKAGVDRIKGKAEETTHVVFGSSTKPQAVALSVSASMAVVVNYLYMFKPKIHVKQHSLIKLGKEHFSCFFLILCYRQNLF